LICRELSLPEREAKYEFSGLKPNQQKNQQTILPVQMMMKKSYLRGGSQWVMVETDRLEGECP